MHADQPGLKPCAHCGGAATEAVSAIGGGGVYSTVSIRCKPCNYDITRSGRVGMTIDQLRAEVAAIWNRRAPIEITDEKVERAEAAYASTIDDHYSHEHPLPCGHQPMRAALVAALGQQEGMTP